LEIELSAPPRSNRRAARNAFVYIILAFLQRGISILILPFVTRVLSPAEYGAVSVVTFTSTIIGVVLGASLEPAVLRWSIRPRLQSARILWLCQRHFYLLVPGISAIVSLFLFSTPAVFLGVECRIWAVEILAAGLLASVAYYSTPLIRARDQLLRFSTVSLIGIAATVGGKIYFVILNHWGVFGWVFSDLLASLATFIAGISLARVDRRGLWRAERVLMRFSAPLLPSRLATWSLNSLNRPIMALVATQASVGIFSLALNIAAVSTMLIGEVNRAFVTEYSRESFPAPSNTTRNYARIQLFLSFLAPSAVGVGIFLFGSALIDIEFRAAFPIAGLLLVGQAAYGVYIVPNNYVVQTSGRTKWSWVGPCVGALTMGFGIILFAPIGGEYAVALVTVVGYVLMAVSAFALVLHLKLVIRWRELVQPGASWIFCFGALSASCASLFFMAQPVGAILALVCVVSGVAVLLLERRQGGSLAHLRKGTLHRVESK
jgi:O-antigen/teichoic acid export membrane protein